MRERAAGPSVCSQKPNNHICASHLRQQPSWPRSVPVPPRRLIRDTDLSVRDARTLTRASLRHTTDAVPHVRQADAAVTTGNSSPSAGAAPQHTTRGPQQALAHSTRPGSSPHPRLPLLSSRTDAHDPSKHPARSALALALAAALSLTASGPGPLDAAAAAAGLPQLRLPPFPSIVTTNPTATVASLPSSLEAPPLAAGVSGQGGAAAAGAGLPVQGPSPPPAVRFTSPEVLDTLPPIPTSFPPLPELQLPSYTTAKLRNGLRVFLLRDEEVPLVRATLLMRGGQYASPPDKVGLASLTAYVQRAGGSTAHPAALLDTRLEELAASIELGAGPQAVSADMQCLVEDTEEVLGLMAELVRSPLLPSDKLALYQAQVYNLLDHQNDSPAAIARRKIAKLLYGGDSIYARTPTKDGIASITPADLAAYVAAWERPDAAVLGVVGAFEPRQMLALVQREFGDWAPAPGQPAEPPAVPKGPPPALPPAVAGAAAPTAGDAGRADATAGPGAEAAAARAGGVTAAAAPAAARRPVVYLVDRPGLTQANVLVAEPGISLSSPDVFALDVLSGVFNSFGGQLFDTLRSREGLAYSVSGSWDSPADHPGLFVAGGQTSSPGEFLRSLRQLLARAASEPPSEAELAAAKSETLNSFAFNFASTSSQLQRILVYDLLGLPQNFLFKYFSGIEAVQRSDVLAAASAHLHPERQAVVVVADRELAGPSLEAAGFEVAPMKLQDEAGAGAL